SHLPARVLYAGNSTEALALLEQESLGLVLTDLQRGEADGLGLIETIYRQHPLVPVILLTAHGNEEIAVQALRRGAASYVAKRNLARDLAGTVEKVLAAARVDRRRQQVREWLDQAELHL